MVNAMPYPDSCAGAIFTTNSEYNPPEDIEKLKKKEQVSC